MNNHAQCGFQASQGRAKEEEEGRNTLFWHWINFPDFMLTPSLSHQYFNSVWILIFLKQKSAELSPAAQQRCALDGAAKEIGVK